MGLLDLITGDKIPSYEGETIFNTNIEYLTKLIEQRLSKMSYHFNPHNCVKKVSNGFAVYLEFVEKRTIFDKLFGVMDKSKISITLSNVDDDKVKATILLEYFHNSKRAYNDFLKLINKEIEKRKQSNSSSTSKYNKEINDLKTKIKRLKVTKVLAIIGMVVFEMFAYLNLTIGITESSNTNHTIALISIFLGLVCIPLLVISIVNIGRFQRRIRRYVAEEEKVIINNKKDEYNDKTLCEICEIAYQKIKEFQASCNKNTFGEIQRVVLVMDEKIDNLSINERTIFQEHLRELQGYLVAAKSMIAISANSETEIDSCIFNMKKVVSEMIKKWN